MLILRFLTALFLISVSPEHKQERQASTDDYDVTFYHLDLNVSDSSTFILGSATINLKPVVTSLSQLVFDLSSLLQTDSVMVDGSEVTYDHESDKLTVDLVSPAGAGTVLSVKIFYHGLGETVITDGIYNEFVSSWNKRVTWTLSEPFSALNFFPCKQSLTDKADSVYVFLSTDNSLKAGSNGLLSASVPLDNNRVRYEWKSYYPIAYYLISFAVSDYMDYSFYAQVPEFNDSVLIQNYIYNDEAYLVQNKAGIDRTGELIALYSELFGMYPFSDEKYGHCVAPFSGGMEHQTMTTLVNFSFLLVAHELTHQWFGDHVTCSTWQDIWINEGFASYGEYLAYQFLVSQENADNWIKSCNDYVKSRPGGSVYLPEDLAESESRIFDSRLSYKKGASIIHMLRQEVGNDSLFFNIMTTFLNRYGNANASGADFRDHVEEKTDKDFGQFFDQWYYGEGYPIHSIRWDHRNDTLYISSLQTASSETSFFNILLEFRITGNNIDSIVSFRQDANFNQWQVYFPGSISDVQADPNHWLLIDHSDISKISEENELSGFKIVPNPARHMVRVEWLSQQPVIRYTMFMADASGKVLMKRESSSNYEEINISSYPSGMYFIIINNNRQTTYKKLIIN